SNWPRRWRPTAGPNRPARPWASSSAATPRAPPRPCAPAPPRSACAPIAGDRATADLLTARVFAALDARLEARAARPVALALSGGGDSMALLDLAARWGQARGRPILALGVDHRLHPDSARWTAFAARAAPAAGASQGALAWKEYETATGKTTPAHTALHSHIVE